MSATMQREVAKRVFAGEFGDASHTFRESDDDRAPSYLLLPSGDKANRVFAVGTLTEKEDRGDEDEYWRARVVDPTGTFLVYAGQYQPDAVESLRGIEPPAYVAVVGKPNTWEPDDGDGDVITSIRPESINEVDAETRDRWVVETAERTLERLDAPPLRAMVEEQYGDLDEERYRDMVIEALETVDD